MSITTARGVARNVLFSSATQAWALLLSLISIRIVVHGLGEDAYGIFAIGSVLLGYVAFFDFGLTAAVVRSIAIHRIGGQPESVEEIVRTAFAILILLGLIGGALLALLTPFLVQAMLHIPVPLRGDASFVFYLASLAFACNMVLVIFAAIPQGLQRLDLLSIRNLTLTTLTAIGQIAVIELGGGLRWLAAVSFASNVASLAVFAVLAPRLIPGVKFWPRISRGAFQELSSFGGKRFISQVGVQAVFLLDRIVVGAFLPIRAVTFYSVPLTITQKFLVFHGSITNAYFPAAAELHGLRDAARMRRLYLTVLKLNAAIVLLLVSLVAGFARPILTAWLGSSFATGSTAILTVLALGYGLTAMVGVSGHLSDAAGHPGWTGSYVVVGSVLNLVISVLLVPRVGAIGAAYALLIQNGVGGLSFLVLIQWRILSLRVSAMLGQLVRPIAAAFVVTLFALLVGPHLRGILEVLIGLALGSALYVGLTWVLGVWDAREQQLARDTVREALSFARRRSNSD